MNPSTMQGDLSAYAKVLPTNRYGERCAAAGHLVIADHVIRQDAAGRYCLNDLHHAAGGLQHHQPGKFFANKAARALVAEVKRASPNSESPVLTVNDGRNNGTYVAKELVYAYAMWISATFHLQVIRAYDSLVSGAAKPVELSRIELLRLATQAEEERLALANEVKQLAPKAAALDRLATATEGSYSLRDAAKSLQIPERKLTQWLHQKHVIYPQAGSGWRAYAEGIKRGFVEVKIRTGTHVNGSTWTNAQVRVTPLGMARISKALTEEGLASCDVAAEHA
ncbi:phage antirepressor KilAC domain-containing protein [Paucibacter sp. DJ1R-11]|uniref:phage antirepressor KilAC domain-containing protein n=1 Tax=Paucibacter sp. DJ1R-11 TaxID=2893556 RepID=UPI0021E3DC04|nr:phage antirepressor KilAC domain-containing protein [Paucibacter sp. DJ1R-11]MCV2362483.1 phage antirepressor KilAC domain-containing protein [Paucibacter sp. DJ1R-11]